MKFMLWLFGALGLVAAVGWSIDALQASTIPMGGLRFNFSIGLAGGSLSFALLCFFGAKVLEAFEDQIHYLIQVRDRLNLLVGPAANSDQAAPAPGQAAAAAVEPALVAKVAPPAARREPRL